MESLFSFQMIYTSQFRKIDPNDWFCGPGSHIVVILVLVHMLLSPQQDQDHANIDL